MVGSCSRYEDLECNGTLNSVTHMAVVAVTVTFSYCEFGHWCQACTAAPQYSTHMKLTRSFTILEYDGGFMVCLLFWCSQSSSLAHVGDLHLFCRVSCCINHEQCTLHDRAHQGIR
jgi:hypothetical protein